MRALRAAELRGVWAAVPTPWTRNGDIDAVVLAENIHRYRAAGVAGVYTTDSDGEFYAVELETFARLAAALGRAVEENGLDAAMGVTWSHTAGIIARIKAALDAGISNVHVGFPFWMPLAPSDVPRFWDELATAAPEARWIHYRTPRAHVLPSGADYQAWRRAHPEQLIGTKLATSDIEAITEIISASTDLAHFAVEYCAVPAALAGARGVYSYWVNTLPEWTLQTWRLCESGCWTAAMQRQARLVRWEAEYVRKLRARGYSHGVLGKARAALSGWLADSGETQAPYYPVDHGLLRELKDDFERFWGSERGRE